MLFLLFGFPFLAMGKEDYQLGLVQNMAHLYRGSYEEKSRAHQSKRILTRLSDISSVPAQRLLVTYLSDQHLRSTAEFFLKRQGITRAKTRRTPLDLETQMDLWNLFQSAEQGERRAAYRILRSMPLHKQFQHRLVSALYNPDLKKPAKRILDSHELAGLSQHLLMAMLDSSHPADVQSAQQVFLRRAGPLDSATQSALIKGHVFHPSNSEKRARGRDILEGTKLGLRGQWALYMAWSQASEDIRAENLPFVSGKQNCVSAFAFR